MNSVSYLSTIITQRLFLVSFSQQRARFCVSQERFEEGHKI